MKLREVIGAGEPLNPEVIEQVKKAWGLTLRDGYGQTETTAQIGNSPGQQIEARLDGPAAAGLPGGAARSRRQRGGRKGEIALALEPRPTGLMLGYKDDPAKTSEVMRRRLLSHRRCRFPRRRRLHHLRRPHRRRVQSLGLPDQPVRAGERADRAPSRSPRRRWCRAPIRCALPCRRPLSPWSQVSGRARELAEDILRFARGRLAPYKRIRRLEFAELPKTISGKIRRVELRRYRGPETKS